MPAQKSPGPADYELKPLMGCVNHDVNSLHARSPCWSISQRPKTTAAEISPSPASYKVGNLTRYGKPRELSVRIGERPATSRIQPSPGPYNPVSVTIYKSANSPQYTIANRKNESRIQKVDGSTLYDIVPLSIYKHTAPKFSILNRRENRVENLGPGPMKYDCGNIYKQLIAKQAPAFTIKERRKESNKEKRPGPADYSLMTYNPFANAPKFTHAVKHSQNEQMLILPQDNC